MSSAPHFFAPASSFSDDRITLDAGGAHHLHVRRARPGDRIFVGDGAGRISEARIESIGPEGAVAAIQSTSRVPAPHPRLTVLQALAKGSKPDWVIEKLVELGVDSIVVFKAGRSIPTWDRGKEAAAAERWQRVALAAAKQSRRVWLPEIRGPLSLDEAVEATQGCTTLIADPGAGMGLREALEAVVSETALVIGPEGGFEQSETDAFVAAGARKVNLGSQILRTETAPVALAAVVLFHSGRLG